VLYGIMKKNNYKFLNINIMSKPTSEPEKIFWKRMMTMHKKFGYGGKVFPFPIVFILVVLGHYMFALMTLLHKFYSKIFTKKVKVSTEPTGTNKQQDEVNNIITASAISTMYQ